MSGSLQRSIRTKLQSSCFADSVGRTFAIHDAVHVRCLFVTMIAYPTHFKNNPRIKLIVKNVVKAAEEFNIKVPSDFRKAYMLPEQFIFR